MSCSDIPDRPIAEQIKALEQAQSWDMHVAGNSRDPEQRKRVKDRLEQRKRLIAELQEKVKP